MSDETLDRVLALLGEVISRIGAIEARLDAGLTIVQPPAAPQPTPLDAFVKPAMRDVSPWAERRDMTGPDVDEAIRRAHHGVNWRGGYLGAAAYEAAWTEIERLKSGDRELIDRYRMLHPEFAGYGLLVGLFAPVAEDRWSWGVNSATREGFAGQTIQSFLDDQFKVGGTPGGDVSE